MESIDWSNLSFGYMPTDYNVRCIYKDGKWGDITVTSSQTFEIHMAATCLHYGQEAFEGMKAFRGKDGKIRIFRMDENSQEERKVRTSLRKRSFTLYTPITNRDIGTGRSQTGQRIFVHRLRISGRSLFQRGFQTYPYGDTPSIRPRRSTRNRTLQSRRELRSQFSGWRKSP